MIALGDSTELKRTAVNELLEQDIFLRYLIDAPGQLSDGSRDESSEIKCDILDSSGLTHGDATIKQADLWTLLEKRSIKPLDLVAETEAVVAV